MFIRTRSLTRPKLIEGSKLHIEHCFVSSLFTDSKVQKVQSITGNNDNHCFYITEEISN